MSASCLSRRQVLGSSVTLALGGPLISCGDMATMSATLDKVTCVTRFGTFGRDSYFWVADKAGQILHQAQPTADPGTAVAELRLMASYVNSASTGFPVGALNSSQIARGIAILAGSGLIPSGLTPDNTTDLSIMGVV